MLVTRAFVEAENKFIFSGDRLGKTVNHCDSNQTGACVEVCQI